MIAPARRAALDALRSVDTRGVVLPEALARLRERLADGRDAALATDIVIGTERWRLALDHRLAALSSRPLEALDAAILAVLRLSAYQLLHLERVPASAIVNDAVALARANAGSRAAGFVNAVLRRLADPATRPALPSRPVPDAPHGAWASFLAITYAHPPWLVRRWLGRLGLQATEARLAHGQAQAPMTLRPVASRATAGDLARRLLEEQVDTRPARFAPAALVVTAGHVLRTPAFDEGLCVVQDEGSQLVALYASAQPRWRVLDVCASPGGKATMLAEAVGAGGLVVAGDVRERRVALLHDTVRRTAAANVLVAGHDARDGLPYGPVFDLVIVDAPCSGIGTLRRDPDLKWRREEGDLAGFAEAQRALLAEAARCVKAGGRLVYATCSSEPEENEAVALWFEAHHRGFARAMPGGPWEATPLRRLLDGRGWLATMPERDGLDAYFAAMFRRRFEGPGAV